MSNTETKIKDVVILGFGTEFSHTYQGKYKETMEKLSNYWLSRGMRFINSSVYQYNYKKEYFNDGGVFDGKKWIHVKKIRPSKVFYKSNKINHLTNHINESFEFLNDLKLVLLANNKYDTARAFKECSPMTLKLSQIESKKFNIDKLTREDYIIKPINGSWGAGIMKVKKWEIKDILEKFWYGKENVIIQDFLDLSCWVPWIVEGIHDLRFSVFGKKLFPHVYVRVPKEWDFRSNISAGGTDFFMKNSQLPKEAVNMAKRIVRNIHATIGGWIYSIDLANTTEGFKLMEINSSPWFLFKEKKIQELFFEYLVDALQ